MNYFLIIFLCSPNSSIKVATLSHTPSQILSNISKAIPAIAAHIPGGWDNIQSLMIKTNTSVSLPIWSCDLDERWSGPTKGGDEGEKTAVEKAKGKKKRSVQENDDEGSEEEGEQPRKKAKSGNGAKSPVSTKPSKKASQSISASSTDQNQKSQKSAKSSAPTSPSSETQTKPKATKKTEKDTTTPGSTQPKTTITKSKPQSEATSLSSSLEANKGLTKTELKQKRAGVNALEKKKGKVVGAKVGLNGKSAKAKMLGKKALQA